MKKRDNDFIDQRLNSLIGNIFLFNSKMEKFNTSRTMLKKSIKTDTEIIGEHFGSPLKVAMFTVDLFIDNENRDWLINKLKIFSKGDCLSVRNAIPLSIYINIINQDTSE